MTLSTAPYPALAPIEPGVPPTVVQPSRDATGNTDVSNIQKAINAMAPTGGVVQLGPGVFYINSTITVPMQSGPGRGATRSRWSGTTARRCSNRRRRAKR